MKQLFYSTLLLLGAALLAAFAVAPLPTSSPETPVIVPQKSQFGEAAAALTLSVAEQETTKNGEVCLTVTARGFQDILTMQYSMNWDPAVLTFKELKSFGLPGLDARNFGLHLLERGIITFSWYDQKLIGISKEDGFSLYELCFEAIGEAGSETSLQFTSKPTVVEISNAASDFLDLQTETGKIKIK